MFRHKIQKSRSKILKNFAHSDKKIEKKRNKKKFYQFSKKVVFASPFL